MQLVPGAVVLVRPDGTVQVGTAEPLVLPGLVPDERRFVAALEDGLVTRADARRHRALVARLVEAGLLAREVPAPATVRVHHHGVLGVAVVAALARAGFHAGFSAAPAIRGGQVGAWWRATQAVRRTAPGWVPPPAEAPGEVEVLVGTGATPPLATTLVARDQPHVIVVVDDAGVTVGPAVRPGSTACGTCADLEAGDADPAWSTLALQCHGRAAATDPSLVDAVGALVTLACRSLAGPGPSPSPLSSRWRIDPSGALHPRPLAPHPACGCGAAGSVGDEVAAQRARMP